MQHILPLGGWLNSTSNDKKPIDLIRPQLARIEHAIWRQFEVEGGGEISLANFDKYMSGKIKGKWSDILANLAEEGLLDRQRLLTASLEALNRGFKQYRAGWFSQFHEQLEPTLEERADRAALYMDLLASPIGPTVSMSIAALLKIQKAGKLDGATLIERIEPAVFASSSKSAKGALKLIAQTATGSSSLSGAALNVVACSLEHPKNDVQESGLTLLEKNAADLDDETRSAIADRLEVMSPLLRSRAEALIGSAPGTKATDHGEEIDLDGLIARARSLPDDLQELAGLSDIIAAAERGECELRSAGFNGMDIPRLDQAGRIVPIEDFTELVDEALIAAEHPEDLDRVERVLAGAIGFAGRVPGNASELLAPLQAPLKRFAGRSIWPADSITPRFALQNVLLALSGGQPEEFQAEVNDPTAVISLRTKSIVDAILAGEPHVNC